MKSFWYGFFNVMNGHIELPYLGESGKYLLGVFAAACVTAAVLVFACFAISQLIADIMLGKFAM